MPTPHDRNNVLAGLFLFGTLALFIATSVVIRQLNFSPRSSYVVRFPISTGAQGITSGSFVHLGGQVVGEVASVGFYPSKEAPTDIDVEVEIDAELLLYENARVYLRTPLLGSGSDLNIAAVGDPASIAATHDGDPRLTDGEWVQGRNAPPAFLADAGWGEEESQALRAIIRDVKDGVGTGKAFVDDADEWWRANRGKATRAADDINAFGSRVRELGDRIPEYDRQVTDVLERGQAFATELGPFAEQLTQAGERSNKVIGDVEQAVASIQEGIDTNRPRVDETVLAAEATAQRLRDQTTPRIEGGAEEFRAMAANVRGLIDAQAPLIRGTLANARLASDQFKLLMVEIRNQPWRLLITPDDKELERQLLYDAARSYAAAAGDVRAASESLESVLSGGVASPGRADAVQRILAELMDSRTRLDRSEELLLDRLIAEQQR